MINNGSFQYGTAFNELKVYEEQEDKASLNRIRGCRKLQHMFNENKKSSVQNDQQLFLQKQPLYFEEVDHHIQEVGLMAVKEVRYISEQEWQQMLKIKDNEQKLWSYIDKKCKKTQRHLQAINRQRNGKGQFICTQKMKDKNKKCKKIKKNCFQNVKQGNKRNSIQNDCQIQY